MTAAFALAPEEPPVVEGPRKRPRYLGRRTSSSGDDLPLVPRDWQPPSPPQTSQAELEAVIKSLRCPRCRARPKRCACGWVPPRVKFPANRSATLHVTGTCRDCGAAPDEGKRCAPCMEARRARDAAKRAGTVARMRRGALLSSARSILIVFAWHLKSPQTNGLLWLGTETIADEADVDKRTVKLVLGLLIAAGLVTQFSRAEREQRVALADRFINTTTQLGRDLREREVGKRYGQVAGYLVHIPRELYEAGEGDWQDDREIDEAPVRDGGVDRDDPAPRAVPEPEDAPPAEACPEPPAPPPQELPASSAAAPSTPLEPVAPSALSDDEVLAIVLAAFEEARLARYDNAPVLWATVGAEEQTTLIALLRATLKNAPLEQHAQGLRATCLKTATRYHALEEPGLAKHGYPLEFYADRLARLLAHANERRANERGPRDPGRDLAYAEKRKEEEEARRRADSERRAPIRQVTAAVSSLQPMAPALRAKFEREQAERDEATLARMRKELDDRLAEEAGRAVASAARSREREGEPTDGNRS